MADVTIGVFDAHIDIITTALETPDPPGLNAKRWNLVDLVTGVAVPVQTMTLPL